MIKKLRHLAIVWLAKISQSVSTACISAQDTKTLTLGRLVHETPQFFQKSEQQDY